MKKMTKVLSLLLTVAMVFSMVTIGTWAAENGKLTADINGTAVVGKTFTVDVSIQNTAETGLVSLTATIGYDSSLLELKDIADANVFGTAVHTIGGNKLTWNNGTATTNYVFESKTKIATLTFEVKDSAAVGQELNITISPTEVYDVDFGSPSFDAAAAKIAVTEEYDIKAVATANISDASLTVGKTAAEVVAYLNENVKTVNITDPVGKGTVAVKNWTAPANYDAKSMTAQEFTAELDVDGVIVKNPDNVKAKANVTLAALTTGTFAVVPTEVTVFQEAEKTYTAEEVAALVKAAVTAINIASGEIADTYDAAAATYTAAGTLAADTIGTSVDVTVKVGGESANKLFNVAADTVAATIPVKVVAAEITDSTEVEMILSTDSVTSSTSSLTVTVKRSDERTEETGEVVISVKIADSEDAPIEFSGAFEEGETELKIDLRSDDFEALLSSMSVGEKLEIGLTYDGAAVYPTEDKEVVSIPVVNASSGSTPSGIPSGGSSSSAQYNITVGQTENGTISVAAKAAKGDTVTVTTTPDSGYKLDKITVVTTSGTNVPVTGNTFVMPGYSVTVTATFVEGTEEPSVTPPEETGEFTDVPVSHWAYEAIEVLKTLGIVNGVTETTFNPDGNVTRAEFTKMVATLFDLKASTTESKFEDCTADDWYTPYVIAASEAGYVNGVDDTHFDPNAQITRQDICTILGRALNVDEAAAEAGFSDVAEIADYAAQYVKSFVALGVVNGYEDGTFRPEASATRAEAAKIIFGIAQIDLTVDTDENVDADVDENTGESE